MKTRIICTLGPTSETEDILRQMAEAGMAIARFNFSHGTHEEQLVRMNTLRKVNKKYGFDVKILQDLEGYRIRVGRFSDGKSLVVTRGETIFLSSQVPSGTQDKFIPFDYDGSLDDFRGLDLVYIDDGNICLKIKKVHSDSIETEVLVGGLVQKHKGVNIPGIRIKKEGLTEKDQRDALFGVEQKVDYMAQSFVRKAEDMAVLREFVSNEHPDCRLIAKIENEQGCENIDEIMDSSDGIMVARGDLGVSMPIEMVPFLQKLIINKCKLKDKIEITATQMLESMVDHIRPTRAEVTDISNAVLEGSTYVMLSGETAKGQFPVHAVRMMQKVIDFATKTRIYTMSLKKEGMKWKIKVSSTQEVPFQTM